ncbi:MAG: DUF4347 domain-containing protein [Cyanobacteriota bacterium]
MLFQKPSDSPKTQSRGCRIEYKMIGLGWSSIATALFLLLASPTGIGEIGNHLLDGRAEAIASDTRRELVFVDRSLPDLAVLLAGIAPEAEVILLDPSQDGIDQIAQVLQKRSGIQALHILSHGSAGSVELGGSVLNLENLNNYSDLLQIWRSGLAADADILIYGCNVAAGSKGELFIEQLAHLTGADISASTNLTGSAKSGGDWILEATTGDEVAPTIVVEDVVRSSYHHILPSQAVPILDNDNPPTDYKLTDVKVGSYSSTIQLVVNDVQLRRNPPDEDKVHIVWTITDINTKPTTMEKSLLIPSNLEIKRGADNVFANTGDPNVNNIERVDFINSDGISVPANADLSKIGFIVLERGGNDPFTISAITKLNSGPTSYQYGPVIPVSKENWGKGVYINTDVYVSTDGGDNFSLSTKVYNQPLSGVFISYQELGLSKGQTFYGFSLAGGDVKVTDDFSQYQKFPINTNPSQGGLDLAASGAIIAFKPVAKDDTASTTVNIPVKIPVLNNDEEGAFPLDPKTVTVVSNPDNGIVGINSTGEITYKPTTTGTNGTDTFTYKVCDTATPPNCDTATVKVTVRAETAGSSSSTSSGIKLVKRITAVNGIPIPGYVNDPTDPNDEPGVTWPGGSVAFLQGGVNQTVQPSSRVEFSIYFLLDSTAANLLICDPLSPGLQYIPGSLFITRSDGSTTRLSDAQDGDVGAFIPPGTSAPAGCGGIPNSNGVVVVNTDDKAVGRIGFEVQVRN